MRVSDAQPGHDPAGGGQPTRRGMVRIVIAAVLLVAAAFSAHASPSAARDVNCSDFSNQASAQAWFVAHGGPAQDPAGLDADHDGVACESLPCPCSTSGTPAPPAPTPAPPVVPTPVPSAAPDTDGDGLDDSVDACPQAAADTSDGCPALPVYLGRLDLGQDFAPDRYLPIGKPARKPQRLTPYTHGGDAIVRVRWKGWGESPADGRGTARLVVPGKGGRKRDYAGVRIALSRLRDGDCTGVPAQFYTRARVVWPRRAHLRSLTVRLVPGCGTQ